MNGIIIRDNEGIDKALRRFLKICDHSGILSELKKSRFYEKPSEKRKRKLNIARRNLLRDKKKIERKVW
jgi:small subunit ribosomal protein S21